MSTTAVFENCWRCENSVAVLSASNLQYNQLKEVCISNIQNPKSAPAIVKVPKTFGATTAFF